MEITIYDNTQSEFYGTQFPNTTIQTGWTFSPPLVEIGQRWRFGLGIDEADDDLVVYVVRHDRRRAYLINTGKWSGKLPLLVPVTSNVHITVNGADATPQWANEIRTVLCKQYGTPDQDVHAITDVNAVEMPPMLRKSFLLPDIQSTNVNLPFASSLIGRNVGIVIHPLLPFNGKQSSALTKTAFVVDRMVNTLLNLVPSKLRVLDFIGSQQLLAGQFIVTRTAFPLDTKSDTTFNGYVSNPEGYVFAAPLRESTSHDTDVLKLPMLKFKEQEPINTVLPYNNAGFFIFNEPTDTTVSPGHPNLNKTSATRLSTMLTLYFSPTSDEELKVMAEKAIYAASLSMCCARDYKPAPAAISNLTRTALRRIMKLSLLAGPDAQVNFRWYASFFPDLVKDIDDRLRKITSRIDLCILVGGFSGLL